MPWWSPLFRTRALRQLTLVNGLVGLASSFVVPFTPLFLAARVGASAAQIGLLLTLAGPAGVLVSSLVGSISDRLPSRKPLIAAGCVATAAGDAVYALSHDYLVVLAASITLLTGAWVAVPQLYARGRELLDLAGADPAPSLSALRSAVSLAWVGGPPLFGLILSISGFPPAFLLVAALMLAAAVLVAADGEGGTGDRVDRQAGQEQRWSWLAGGGVVLAAGAVMALQTANSMSVTTMPLLITVTMHGSPRDVGLVFGLTATLEIPVMLGLGWAAGRLGSLPVMLVELAVRPALFRVPGRRQHHLAGGPRPDVERGFRAWTRRPSPRVLLGAAPGAGRRHHAVLQQHHGWLYRRRCALGRGRGGQRLSRSSVDLRRADRGGNRHARRRPPPTPAGILSSAAHVACRYPVAATATVALAALRHRPQQLAGLGLRLDPHGGSLVASRLGVPAHVGGEIMRPRQICGPPASVGGDRCRRPCGLLDRLGHLKVQPDTPVSAAARSPEVSVVRHTDCWMASTDPPSSARSMRTTWDGQAIADDSPTGAVIAVYRRRGDGLEWLLLHRAHRGPDYNGDWAWGTPSGCRQPGEAVDACARRELLEEAGLDVRRTLVLDDEEWPIFLVEAQSDTEVRLSAEHDSYRWVDLATAIGMIEPARVAEQLGRVAHLV